MTLAADTGTPTLAPATTARHNTGTMERRGLDNPLLQRILSTGSPVVVVRGPAGCGKTAAALAIYRSYLDEMGSPKCLLLGPNSPAVRDLRHRITDGSAGGVAVSPAVMTFASLAARVLGATGEQSRSASPFERRLLLAGIVDELNSAGQLAAIGAVADTPGLVVALDRAIAEIKRAAIEPDDLARAVGGARDRRGDLVAIYRRYQEELQERGLYDVEGQAWLTREHLREVAGATGFEGIRAIVADGFTDFTPTQLEILAAMARRVERVVITLPHATDNRRRMWHWTDRTLNNIRRQFGADLAEIEIAGGPGVGAKQRSMENRDANLFLTTRSRKMVSVPIFRGLWDSVFDIDAGCDLPGGLSVIAAAGMDSEVAAVARRVKRLLVGGAGGGRIAVLARSMDAYAATIRRVFAEHDIPLAPAAETLTETPIVRFAMDVTSLAPEFAWHDVLRVIRNSYFRPAALGDFDERTVAAAEMLIRAGNVQAGRKSYEDAAERMALRAEAAQDKAGPDGDADEPDESPTRKPTADEYRQAKLMLGEMFDLSARAAAPAGLSEVAETLQLPRAACELGEPELVARDLRALATLADHLDHLPDPPPPANHVRNALSAVMCPAARGESLVDVLDVLDARAIRYDHVFVLGVSERMFPSQHNESSLVGESDRANWLRRGVVLDNRSDLTAREMLLFYLAITRAEKTLTLSYLESDANGAAGSPSSFLLALAGAVGGLDNIPTEQIAPGPYIPPEDELASRRDALCAGLGGLFGSELPPSPKALAWSAQRESQAVRRAAMGIYAAHRRWEPAECSQYDGRITDESLLAELHRHYTSQPYFSAARFNSYGQCPWQYFARYILKLAEPIEPERRLEPAERGTFCHNVLFNMMRSLAGEAGEPVQLPMVPKETLDAALDEAIQVEAKAVELRKPPYPVLWQIQLDQMHRDLSAYLQAAASQDSLDTTALRFELSFGIELDPDQPHDDRSTPEPVIVSTPAGEIRLRGRLDRVDYVAFEDVEGLLVVDYKTGRLPSEKDVLAGRNLQMPLYAAAAEAMLGDKCVGGAFHKIGGGSGRFERFFAGVTTARGKQPYKVDDSYDAKLEAAMETVGQFVRQMGQGRFDVLPTHDCPSYCPLRQICQHSPVRAERKTPPTVADANSAGADGSPGGKEAS